LKRRLDNGDVLLGCPAADANTREDLAVFGQGNAAAHGAETAPSDRRQDVERLSRLHEREEVGGAHPYQGGGVGLPLGDLEREEGAPFIRCCNTRFPWTSTMQTATGTLAFAASASTRSASALVFLSRSIASSFLRSGARAERAQRAS
jgi:hypothetical protein